MRRLLLLRHAKSSWEDPSLDDFDRPLAPRGERAAPAIADFMRSKKLIPDLVLCSSAVRARQTWHAVANKLGSGDNLRELKSLYLATPSRLLQTLRRAPQKAETVLVIGHNPGMEIFALRLTGKGPRNAMRQMAEKFPTAALAEIAFDVEKWSEIGEGRGVLKRFVRPKDLT